MCSSRCFAQVVLLPFISSSLFLFPFFFALLLPHAQLKIYEITVLSLSLFLLPQNDEIFVIPSIFLFHTLPLPSPPRPNLWHLSYLNIVRIFSILHILPFFKFNDYIFLLNQQLSLSSLAISQHSSAAPLFSLLFPIHSLSSIYICFSPLSRSQLSLFLLFRLLQSSLL